MFSKKKLDKNDLYQFFSIMWLYYSAGISLIDAINAYGKNAIKPAAKKIAVTLVNDIQNGHNFSDAMRKHTFFSPYTVEMVKIGEETATLLQIFDEIMFFLEQEIDLKRELNAGLLPVKMFLAGGVIVLFVTIMLVLPKMGEIINDVGAETPAITQIVIALGNAMQEFWWLLGIIAVGLYLIYKNMQQYHPEKLETITEHIPFFGAIYHLEIQYRFTKIFSLCLAAQLPAYKALQYTAMSVESCYLKKVLMLAAKKIEHGGIVMSDAVVATDEMHGLDNEIYIMLKTGEKSGKISEILNMLAVSYRKKLISLSKTIGGKVGPTIIAPLMIFTMALLASVYIPMISVMGAATGNV